MKNQFSHPQQHWLFAILYALFFVFLIPWTDILGREFTDIANYLNRIVYLKGDGSEAIFSGVQWLLDEPLWKWIIIAIGYIFDDYRFALYSISLIAMLLYGSFFFRRIEYYIIMILLINPMTVNLFIEQVRIVLAFSLVLVAYDLSSKRFAALLLIMAFLIHASMPIFIGLYFILYGLNKMVEARKYYLVAIAVAVVMALFMRYGLDFILHLLGDRHAGYSNVTEGSSLAYSVVWFMIAMVLSVFADFENEKERILVAYAIVFMSFFFFSSLLGMFSQRYVAVIMPIIIIAISLLPKHFKQVTYVSLFAYNLLMFKYWLSAG